MGSQGVNILFKEINLIYMKREKELSIIITSDSTNEEIIWTRIDIAHLEMNFHLTFKEI